MNSRAETRKIQTIHAEQQTLARLVDREGGS
jgi:hypothetical protein